MMRQAQCNIQLRLAMRRMNLQHTCPFYLRALGEDSIVESSIALTSPATHLRLLTSTRRSGA